MEWIWSGIVQAIQLLLNGDREVLQITFLTLKISGTATGLSLLVGLPVGTILALNKFRSRRFWLSLINTGMALPPVVVGLTVSLFLWRSGPVGGLELMYTPSAIIFAQFIIAMPIVTGLTVAALQQLDPRLQMQLLGLGATRIQMIILLWREARLPLLAAFMAGFGGVVSEVGASMMVGGNLRYHTRVLTTAIVLENSRGEFGTAIALSVILLLLAYLVTLALTWIQQKGAHG